MGPEGGEPSAVVLLYPGCTIAETIELSTRLADAGIEVSHVAADHEQIQDRSGLLLKPGATIDGAASGFDVLIIPGGDPAAIVGDDRVLGFVAEADRNGAVIAGICAGVLVMAAAGILSGRSVTHNYREPWAPPEITSFVEHFWEGATVETDPRVGVVADDRIITALPNAGAEFTTTVFQRLGLYSAEQAALIRRHLRGEYVEDLYHND